MISRAPRRSTVVVIVIVQNRLYDATAAATVQHCRRSSSQPHAPSLALFETRGTTVATVQRCSSSQPHAPPLALSGTRGTTVATVQRRRSSQPHAPSLALSGTTGTTAATVQRRRSSHPPRPFSSFGWDQRYACHSRPPVNTGLANNIAQGQAQRDVGVDDRAEQQWPTTKIDCHGGPVPEVSGPPEATGPLARGGLTLQARRQRRL